MATATDKDDKTSIRLRDPAILGHLRDLVGETAPLSADTVTGLLLELKRRRRDEDRQDASRPSTLEQAAEVLLSVMDVRHQDQVEDAHRNLPGPKWLVMLGAVARCADNGELLAGEWGDLINRVGEVQPTPKVVACQGCGLVIPGARRGQTGCCNRCVAKKGHSDGCPAVAGGVEAVPA